MVSCDFKIENSCKKKTGIFNNTIIGESNKRRKEKRQRFNGKKTGKGGGVPLPEACMAGQPRQGLRSHVGTGWVATHG